VEGDQRTQLEIEDQVLDRLFDDDTQEFLRNAKFFKVSLCPDDKKEVINRKMAEENAVAVFEFLTFNNLSEGSDASRFLRLYFLTDEYLKTKACDELGGGTSFSDGAEDSLCRLYLIEYSAAPPSANLPLRTFNIAIEDAFSMVDEMLGNALALIGGSTRTWVFGWATNNQTRRVQYKLAPGHFEKAHHIVLRYQKEKHAQLNIPSWRLMDALATYKIQKNGILKEKCTSESRGADGFKNTKLNENSGFYIHLAQEGVTTKIAKKSKNDSFSTKKRSTVVDVPEAKGFEVVRDANDRINYSETLNVVRLVAKLGGKLKHPLEEPVCGCTCEKIFVSEKKLKEHKRRCNMKKNYPFDLCAYLGVTPPLLKIRNRPKRKRQEILLEYQRKFNRKVTSVRKS
jgi:hypothetical protein